MSINIKVWRDNILKNIGKLNAMSGHNLHFKLEEKEHGLFLTEHDPKGQRFGIFDPYVFFEDYISK